jgi:hypothetical protein
MTSIKKCTCEHETQDKWYGKGMRVFNLRESKKTWLCTVCSRETSSDK